MLYTYSKGNKYYMKHVFKKGQLVWSVRCSKNEYDKNAKKRGGMLDEWERDNENNTNILSESSNKTSKNMDEWWTDHEPFVPSPDYSKTKRRRGSNKGKKSLKIKKLASKEWINATKYRKGRLAKELEKESGNQNDKKKKQKRNVSKKIKSNTNSPSTILEIDNFDAKAFGEIQPSPDWA